MIHRLAGSVLLILLSSAICDQVKVAVIDVAPLFKFTAGSVEFISCVAAIDAALVTDGAFVATGVPGIDTASAMRAAQGLFALNDRALEQVGSYA